MARRERALEPIRWKDYTFEPEAGEWLIHDLLPREGVGVIYGKWKSFKSFVALDLGVAIARRDHRLWASRATRQGTVVYICCEGAGRMRKRIEAYKRVHGLNDLDFYVVAARPSLGVRAGDARELIEAIRAVVGDDVPVLVIIDTLARTLAGKDENGEGMRNFVDNAEDVADAFRCVVPRRAARAAFSFGRPTPFLDGVNRWIDQPWDGSKRRDPRRQHPLERHWRPCLWGFRRHTVH